MTANTFRKNTGHPLRLLVLGFIGLVFLPAAVGAAPLVRGNYIKASNTGTGDQFGYAVALSGNLMVVGAPNESSNSQAINGPGDNDLAPISGAAYVFVRSGTRWVQQAYLKATDAAPGDSFGRSVAVSGETVVIGAPWKGGNAGAAYVFVRSGSTWTQQAILTSTGTGAGDYFGESVSVSGDTALVGASGQDNRSGAAYVFVRNGSTWTQQRFLKAPIAEPEDRFGFSVAVYGDTAVVGAYNESSNARGVDGDPANNEALSSGAAYVFIRAGGVWSQQAYLKASNAEASDFFGEAVALFGDTIIVGASGESSGAQGVNGDETDNGASRAGAAYVFVRSGATWSQQAYLKASNAEENDRFGRAVAIFNDIAVIGAWGEASGSAAVDGNQGDNSTPEAGSAYVFRRQGAAWSQEAYLKALNAEAADYFGWAVAAAEKVIAVGADGEDSQTVGINGDPNQDTASMSGAVYMFDYPVIYLPVIFNLPEG